MSRIQLGTAVLSGALLLACGTSANGTGQSAGGTSGGNAALGGASSGGASNNGTTGGSNTGSGGNSSRGGSSSGGASGASSSGGTSSSAAGSSSGGATGGGISNGGISSGGASAGAANGGASSAGASSGGASTGGGNNTAGAAGAASALPPLTVDGPVLKDPSGKTIVLRGSSLIDIGTLYSTGGMNVSGITARMDKVAAAGVQGHVVRLPVYPKIVYNGTVPTCSPVPYPVGTGSTATCTPKSPLTSDDYVSRVLKPAVDYATSKGLYVIVDFHQIDSAITGNSAADAKTFWTDIAPRFANYSNVLYEAFNEPIDNTSTWAALKPVVQGVIDVIRAGAPNNIIIVPSNTWCQLPGDASSSPPSGKNFMYTAHIYPNNWKQAFQAQVATAVTKAPVFISEWGYNATDAASFSTGLQTTVDGNGASWTAWVTDNSWGPPMFSDKDMTQLNAFGNFAKTWLDAKASDHWLQ